MEKGKPEGIAFLSTVQKSLKVLELLNTSPNQQTSELSRETGFSRPSVQRVLHTLSTLGYIVRDERTKRYRPTDRVLNLSMGYTFNSRLASLAEPLILSAAKSIAWPLILTRPNGLELEVLATTQNKNPFAIQKLTAGHRIPLTDSASGRVYLAHSSQLIRDNYLTLASEQAESNESVGVFRSDIIHAQNTGYAFYQKKGEAEKSLAVPILMDNQCCAGLVVRFISSALRETVAIKQVLPTLTSTAAIIGHQLEHGSLS